MAGKMIKKINSLLSEFKHAGKYKDLKLPIRNINDFKNLPFSDKNQLRGFDPDFCPSPVFNITATSGTTASRLNIFHSKQCYYTHLRRVAKTYKSIGVKGGDLCLNICSYALNSGGRIMENAFKSAGAGVIPFGTLDSKEKLAEAIIMIKKLKPDILNSYTNQLYDMFSVLKDAHSIKKCVVNGEPLISSYKKDIEKLSGAKIYNNYGSMEFSGFAITKNPGDEFMELFEDGLFIEVLKDDGSADDTGRGKIVVTDLENSCMPFIRYVLGDIVEIIKRKNKRFIKVQGRAEDSILIEGEIFSKVEIIKTIQEVLGHPNFFIVVDKNRNTYKDKILINITPKDKDKIEKIKNSVEKKLRIEHLVSFRNHSGPIPKTSTGKFRHLIDLREND